MAVNNIKIFDQNKANMLTDEAYSSNVQRINGVQQGIASSQLQNKTLYQVSLVAYAIGQMMQANGLDANDADAVSTFANNMSQTIMQKVLDKANSDEVIAGTDNTKFITPATLKASIGSYTGKNLKNNDFRSYTTVLEAANAAAPGGTFFATNAPDPLYNAADRPFGISAEFQYLVLCDTDNARKTVLAFNFNQTAGTYWYSRNIWQGNWKEGKWKITAESSNTFRIFANADSSQRSFIMSPRSAQGYVPGINMPGNLIISYMLPNQQANLFISIINSSTILIRISNISTGINYDAYANNFEGSSQQFVLAAYDDDSCIISYISNYPKANAYRYSAVSAAALASIDIINVNNASHPMLHCRQNAFTSSSYLVGPTAIQFYNKVIYISILNKSNNQLTRREQAAEFPYSENYNVVGQLVRPGNFYAFISTTATEYSTANNFVYVLNEDGSVYSVHGYNQQNYRGFAIVGCVIERICLATNVSGGRMIVCDKDGGSADSTISTVTFNLPDKSCLSQNAHYSNWNGPDAYPGADVIYGYGLNSNWNVVPGYAGHAYESYNARILGNTDENNLFTTTFCIKASAVPYAMFFL